MGFVRMAILAGKIPFHRRNGYTSSGDHVITRLVTVLASEIHTPIGNPHVHIMILVRFHQHGAHVTVFYRIAATAAKVAVHAAIIPAGSSHILCDGYQVQILHRKTGISRRFLILAGGVMANQTIDSVNT